VVLVLSTVLFAASIFAYWGLRSDTSTAGADRLSRQLFDCAEQGLAVAKQYFTLPTVPPSSWPSYYQSSQVCNGSSSNLWNACSGQGGPFPMTPPTTAPAAPQTYPNSAPFTQQLLVALPNGQSETLTFTFGIMNAPSSTEDKWGQDSTGAPNEKDRTAIIYSRCVESLTNRSRSVSAVIYAPPQNSNDYQGVDGHGMRNQGNFNN